MKRSRWLCALPQFGTGHILSALGRNYSVAVKELTSMKNEQGRWKQETSSGLIAQSFLWVAFKFPPFNQSCKQLSLLGHSPLLGAKEDGRSDGERAALRLSSFILLATRSPYVGLIHWSESMQSIRPQKFLLIHKQTNFREYLYRPFTPMFHLSYMWFN